MVDGKREPSISAEGCNYRVDQKKKDKQACTTALIEGNDSSGLQSNTEDLVLIN